jgi:lysine 2,3-aminomutase
VKGAGHFRTTVSKGIEIIEGLRGHTSGYAVPTYVVDAPGGGGKIPVMPQYFISQSPGKVVLRNYEGYITTYDEPADYDPHLIDHLDREAVHRQEEGQQGVAALLSGESQAIKPEGFDLLHRRGGGLHRLNGNAAKWQPYHHNGNGHNGNGHSHNGNGHNGNGHSHNGNGHGSTNGSSHTSE